jgi:hypothetical protein
MTLTETNLNQRVDLSGSRSVIPGTSRDQTRVARARWAEVVLKMRARSKSGRLADLAALKMRDRFF